MRRPAAAQMPSVASPKRTRVTLCDRSKGFPLATPDEVSVISWNLLSPAAEWESVAAWDSQRWPCLQMHLEQFGPCDILCFQEVDPEVSLHPLREMLSSKGFDVIVQDKPNSRMVLATFFKRAKFQVIWSNHRSRALLTSFQLEDGSELCLLNVHLEAGGDATDLSQRNSQLSSALRRFQERKADYAIICGDFNETLADFSNSHEMLTEDGFLPTERVGPTHCHGLALDHVWATNGLECSSVLATPMDQLMVMLRDAFPSATQPSDHLPVGAMFRLRTLDKSDRFFVEYPASVDALICAEWACLLRCRVGQAGKQARKQQRKLEAAFLANLVEEHAVELRKWSASARSVAEELCSSVLKQVTLPKSRVNVGKMDNVDVVKKGG